MSLKEIVTNLKLVEVVDGDGLDNYTTIELLHMIANSVIETGNTLPISLLFNIYYAGELPLLLVWEFLSRCYNEGSQKVKECVAREAILVLHFLAVREMLDKAGY